MNRNGPVYNHDCIKEMTATRTIGKFSLLLLLLFCSGAALAQKEILVKGTVLDSLEKFPLDSVKVSLLAGKKELHAFTDSKGFFSLRMEAGPDSVQLRLSRRDFRDISQTIYVHPPVTDAGSLFLPALSRLMEDVVIKARIPPISVRNDTTEYVIDSFRRKKRQVIGDVLKDLPGFEVAEDGTITHNGKPVTRILVNGEEYFGGSLDIALGQLPAELIARLQVMDTRTKEDIFNGVDGNGEEKTINLRLKMGLQAFGTAQADGGLKGTYRASLMANVLQDTRHVGLIANGTSTYQRPITEHTQRLPANMLNLALHYNDKISKGLRVNGSVNNMNSHAARESKRLLQQFFTADSTFTNSSYSLNDDESRNTQGSLALDFEKGSKFMGNFNLSFSDFSSSSSSALSSSITENGKIKNESERSSLSKGSNTNINANLSLNRRFDKKGRNLTLTFRFSHAPSKYDNLNNSNNRFYEDGNFQREEILRQHIYSNTLNYSGGITINYFEPIAKDLRLQVNQMFDLTSGESKRITYNIDQLTQKETYDSVYSNSWSNEGRKSSTNISLVYDKPKLNLTAGMVGYRYYQQRTLPAASLEQRQQSYSPNLTANYKITKTRSLRFSFLSTVQYPFIEQMQPLPDNSNPMYIRLGNPELRPSLQQNYNMGYNAAYENGKMLSFSLGYAPTSNSIVNAGWYDADRRRYSQFINVNGVYNLRGNWNFNKTITVSKSASGWSTGGNAVLGRGVYFNNTEMLFTRNFSIRQSVGYNSISKKDKRRIRFNSSVSASYTRNFSPSDPSGINTRNFNAGPKLDWSYAIESDIATEIQFTYTATYNKLSYSLVSRDQEYTDHSVRLSFDKDFSPRFSARTQLDYRYNGRLPKDFASRQQWIWTVYTSVYVFKNRDGIISFSASDILNSYQDVSRMISDNSIEDVQQARSRNPFQISFQYNWMKRNKKETEELNKN